MNNNKTLITAFSLSPKSEVILKRLQKRLGKTRSEIVRNLINSYAKSAITNDFDKPSVKILPAFNQDETNKILKYYYQIITSADHKPTLVIGIAVVSKSGKVLIGLRKASDLHVKNLSWTFPSGKFLTLGFEK